MIDTTNTIALHTKRAIARLKGDKMAWKVVLDFVDYFRNVSPRTLTLDSSVASANDGESYSDALAYAGTLATAAAAISDCDVYVNSVYWKSAASAYDAASVESEVKKVLKVKFDLIGKTQKGGITIPSPDYSVVLDANRHVDQVAVRNSDFIQAFLDGQIRISDGDLAEWMNDADIVTLKGNIETE